MRLPLTTAQAGIWYGQQLDPASPAYNTADLIEIHGPFDRDRFVAALRTAVDLAEGLHARYDVADDGPYQIIDERVLDDRPEWTVHEAEVSSVAEAESWCRADLATPVELSVGPVFRHALFRLGPEHHLWYQRIHHVAVDGFGTALLLRRVAEVYTAGPGAGTGFAPLAPVIGDDRAYAGSDRAAAAGAFWQDHLAGAPEPASPAGPLAADTRPAHSFRRVTGTVTAGAVAALRAAGGLTGAEALIAAAAVWLHRATAAAEVVLGLPVMGRLGTPALRVPTSVMNIVPLRVRIGPGDTFPEVVERVAGELRAGRPHHRYRHEQLRRDRRPAGTGGRLFGPVVNVLPFAVDLRFGAADAVVRNLSAGPVEDLSLALRELPAGGFRLELDGHPARYDDGALARHRDAFLDTVTALGSGAPVSDVDGPVGMLTGTPLAPTGCVLDEIRARVTERPDAVAVDPDLSYVDLWRGATALAGRLAAAGAGPGSLVAVALPRGTPAVTAILATMLAGAAYLPLDPSAPAARTAELIADAGPVLVVADGPGHWPLPVIEVGDGAPALPRRSVPADELAYVIYTSGSTGRPKGVAVSRGALAHFTAAARALYGLGPADRVVQFAPLHFDASVEELFGTLSAGGTLVIRPAAPAETPDRFLRWCGERGVTVLDLPTAYWHELTQAVHSGTAAVPPTLRGVIIGGEAALPERVAQWRAVVPRSVALWNTYGPTEATVVATIADL